MTGTTAALLALAAVVVVFLVIRGLTRLAVRMVIVVAAALVAWNLLGDGGVDLPLPG